MAQPRLECLALRQISKKGAALNGARLGARTIWSDHRTTTFTSPYRLLPTPSALSSFHTTSPSSALADFSRPNNPRAIAAAQRLIAKAEQNNRRVRDDGRPSTLSTVEEVQKHTLSVDLSKQITRRWRAGDIYAPHDLSGVEMKKWKQFSPPSTDVFDVLDFDPMMNYKNFSIMSEFMTPMGRIQHSKNTGLRPKNHRKIARAIRRSIGLGLMPSVYRHPEILMRTTQRNQNRTPSRGGPVA